MRKLAHSAKYNVFSLNIYQFLEICIQIFRKFRHIPKIFTINFWSYIVGGVSKWRVDEIKLVIIKVYNFIFDLRNLWTPPTRKLYSRSSLFSYTTRILSFYNFKRFLYSGYGNKRVHLSDCQLAYELVWLYVEYA